VVDLGLSAQGRPLTMYVFGDGERPLLVIGGIHGNEPTGAELSEKLIDYLRANSPMWRDHPVAVLPRANPDGLAACTRVNGRGVDVNRNFPAKNWRKTPRNDAYGGPSPLSETESKAIATAVDTLHPWAIISIHSISTNEACNNYDGPAEDLARRMSALNGYPAKGSIGYPTPGSMGSWAGGDRGIPMVTLELPRNLSGQKCWETNRQALLTIVEIRPPPTSLGK